VTPGPAPLAIITRVTIQAATAVAARNVKNQNKRFPRRTNRLARCEPWGDAAMVDRARDEDGAFTVPGRPPLRRCGESQGQTAWNWRLFTTPDRPYNTSTTTATKASSFKPIMIPQLLEVDLVPVAPPPAKARGRFLASASRERRVHAVLQW